jgi:hypothetical protein
MVYNTGAQGLTDVRIATGNLLATDYADTQLTEDIAGAFATIQLATGRTLLNPFISTDVEYAYAKALEKKIAARDALKAYSADPEIRAKVQELDEEVTRDLAFLKENIVVDTGDTQILVAVTDYLSYGALLDENPDNIELEPYRSGLTDSV